MKNHILWKTGLIYLCFLSFTMISALGVFTPETENEFSRKLKTQLSEWNEKRPEERIYLQFDKTLYAPGETIWFSAYIREAISFAPSRQSEIIHVEFIQPNGNVDKALRLICKNGKAAGDITIPEEYPGGIYKIKAYSQYQKNEAHGYIFEKNIQVQDVVIPNLKMTLEFERKAYGPGDEVTALIKLEDHANKLLTNQPFQYQVSLSGEQVSIKQAATGNNGEARISFNLPQKIKQADGLLNILATHEGNVESISRSIPIVLNKISMSFFPEGGDLPEGVLANVAFRALNEFNKPADVEGYITDSRGNRINNFQSYHQGMGAFLIKAEAGETYTAHITRPEGIKETYILPETNEEGVSLIVTQENSDRLLIKLRSTTNQTLTLIGQVRGQILYTTEVQMINTEAEVIMPLARFPAGVCQLTVFDENNIAISERLVFVNMNKRLTLHIKTDKEQYAPGEKVTATLDARDDNNQPVKGNFSVSVTHDGLLSLSDDKQGDILTQLLLEQDIQEKIEEPGFYFSGKPKAAKGLDLVMLTSGWRRFEWEQIQNGAVPALSIKPEKAILQGVLMDAYRAMPIKNAEIVFNKKIKVRTDDHGKFSTRKLDLARETEMVIQHQGYQILKEKISSYEENKMIYLYPEHAAAEVVNVRGEWLQEDAVLEAVPIMQDEMQIRAAQAAPRVDAPVKKNAPVAREVKAVFPNAKDKANAGQNENKPVLAKQQQRNNPGNNKIVPAGFGRKPIMPMEGEPVKVNAVGYHRARKFPEIITDKSAGSKREDFRSTIFWKQDLKTDDFGSAVFSFVTSDEITSFKCIVEGIGLNGYPGKGEYKIYNQLPFSVSAKTPVSLVQDDIIDIPFTIVNNTAAELNGTLEVNPPSFMVQQGQVQKTVPVAPHESKTIYIRYLVGKGKNEGELSASYTYNGQHDAFRKSIKTVAKGFPAVVSFSGREKRSQHSFEVNNLVEGSLIASVTAYPNVVSDLMKGIESILNEPNGCFEQTSASSYPNVMVRNYLETIGLKDEKLKKHTEELLDRGYKKLVSYETKEQGYEWFGSAPAHEALTAYGLMQFTEMARVYKGVDHKMVDRTAEYLLASRDGTGGYKRSTRALDTFGRADKDITNAYITYALSSSGFFSHLGKELNKLYDEASKSEDAYLISLACNALYANNKDRRANNLLEKLLGMQYKDGSFNGTRHSITRSTHLALKIETTSLAILAMLQSENAGGASLTKAVEFLVNSRQGTGGFGNSQSTIMALKALTKYAEYSKQAAEPGGFEVYVNGIKAGEKFYAAGCRDMVSCDGLEKYLTAGKNKIEVKYLNTDNPLPFTINVQWNTTLPNSSEDCKIDLKTEVEQRTVKAGETLRLNARIINKTREGLPSTMVVLGIPGGFSVQPWQLKEIMEKKQVDYYEIKDNALYLYYRHMAPSEEKLLHLDLKAEVKGNYEAPAGSAYLYYTNEFKTWCALPTVKII